LIHCVLYLTADDFWDQEIVLNSASHKSLAFGGLCISLLMHWEHVAQMQQKNLKYAKCGVQNFFLSH